MKDKNQAIMKKIYHITILTAFMLFLPVFVGLSEAKTKSFYTPCQYKGAYKYYMDRGQGYFDDKQYESAIESFERALIIQPNSKEARSKIALANAMLSGKKIISKERVRKDAMEHAISYSEYISKKPVVTLVPQKEQSVDSEKPKRRVVAKQSIQDSYYSKPDPNPAKSAHVSSKPKPGKKIPPLLTKQYIDKSPEPEFSQCRLLPVFDEFSNSVNSKIQEGTDNINNNIAPSEIRGEYRIAFGATEDDFIWKDANADYHNMPGDTSWRYI